MEASLKEPLGSKVSSEEVLLIAGYLLREIAYFESEVEESRKELEAFGKALAEPETSTETEEDAEVEDFPAQLRRQLEEVADDHGIPLDKVLDKLGMTVEEAFRNVMISSVSETISHQKECEKALENLRDGDLAATRSYVERTSASFKLSEEERADMEIEFRKDPDRHKMWVERKEGVDVCVVLLKKLDKEKV